MTIVDVLYISYMYKYGIKLYIHSQFLFPLTPSYQGPWTNIKKDETIYLEQMFHFLILLMIFFSKNIPQIMEEKIH